jgi:hypothetical protein
MIGKLQHLLRLKNPKVYRSAIAAVWIVLMVTVVAPTWQGVMANNDEIHDLETRLGTMDDWTVAGMWLAQSVNERTLPVNAAFSRLFPSERGREELFLSLAQVADKSGVDEFNLSETNVSGMDVNDVWTDGTDMAQNDTTAPPPMGDDHFPGDEVVMDIPTVEMSSYRVIARFSGDYQRIAHFMTDLKNIDRALKVHSLVIRPERDAIQVDLELDVYVSKTS